MKDISFIIPVYNTPTEIIRRCIESILELRAKYNIEIIVIDDGSEKYVSNFFESNFVEDRDVNYFYKNNGGVSSARNMGITLASGRYLFFSDADDFVIPSSFYCFDNSQDYELIIFDLNVCENLKETTWKVLRREAGNISKKDIIMELISNNKMNSPCSKLFLRKCIKENGIKFKENMVTGEDMDFLIEYLRFTSRYYYTGISAYCYQREESSRILRIKKYPDIYYDNIAYLNNKLILLIEKYKVDKHYIDLLKIDHINSIYNYVSDLMQLNLFTEKRKEKISDAVLMIRTKPQNLKYFVKYKLLVGNHWVFINILSYVRNLYLKFK